MSTLIRDDQGVKLVAGLTNAVHLVQPPSPLPILSPVATGMGLFSFAPIVPFAWRNLISPVKPQPRIGIPYGVESLRMRAKMVRIKDKGKVLAYCQTHDYTAEVQVPPGDLWFPNGLETHVICPIPKDGHYNMEFWVTIRSRNIIVVVEKLIPTKVLAA